MDRDGLDRAWTQQHIYRKDIDSQVCQGLACFRRKENRDHSEEFTSIPQKGGGWGVQLFFLLYPSFSFWARAGNYNVFIGRFYIQCFVKRVNQIKWHNMAGRHMGPRYMWDLYVGGNSDLRRQSTWFIAIDLECLYGSLEYNTHRSDKDCRKTVAYDIARQSFLHIWPPNMLAFTNISWNCESCHQCWSGV